MHRAMQQRASDQAAASLGNINLIAEQNQYTF